MSVAGVGVLQDRSTGKERVLALLAHRITVEQLHFALCPPVSPVTCLFLCAEWPQNASAQRSTSLRKTKQRSKAQTDLPHLQLMSSTLPGQLQHSLCPFCALDLSAVPQLLQQDVLSTMLQSGSESRLDMYLMLEPRKMV